MSQVALAKEPFEVAIGGIANGVATQRRALAAVSRASGLVTLLAMVAEKEGACGNRIGVADHWIDPLVILGGNMIPVEMSGSRKGQSSYPGSEMRGTGSTQKSET